VQTKGDIVIAVAALFGSHYFPMMFGSEATSRGVCLRWDRAYATSI
jgi:hypothetical protein